jgi:hypothetical protein
MNVVEVHHSRLGQHLSVGMAVLDVIVEARGERDAERIMILLRERFRYRAELLNE